MPTIIFTMQTRYVPFLLTLFLFTIAGKLSLQAQILKPATWQVSWSEEKAAVGEEIDLVFTVTIDPDWYLYSSDFDPDLGPMVTEFTFEPAEGYELVGDIKPIGAKEKYDELWEGTYTYFTGKAEFRQTVKVLNEKLDKISGSYSYQVCTDVDGRCIPFDDEFALSIPLGGKASSPTEGSDEVNATGKSQSGGFPISIWGLFILAFGAGITALATPCVFPMIPMTVTFFLNSSNSRSQGIKKASFYGVSIILMYTVIGTAVSLLFGGAFLNSFSTHWLPNLLFFTLFVLFALSFLGLFEITLPSSFVNKIDTQADKGGYYGAFFMAFTLAAVSFSCTIPIVGTVIALASGGEVVRPVIGMLGYSLAFAVPFTLFAIFPQWLSSLPKSGGWLNSVKVVLGFLELALALKFLSVADQVYHWNILDREVYLALWIVIFALIGFYLLGKIRLPHDSPLESVSVPRLMLSVVTFAFVVYLIPGLFGAPLKALAGYLPPMHTHDFNMPMLIAQQQVSNSGTLLTSNEEALCEEPKHSELLHFPHGIQGYFDYDQALACAQAQNKPIFIDFTGHGCVNCREMEARVWSDPAVLQRLKKDFVVVALYVDEKTELPESDWYTSEYDGKVKKSIGKQNADLQIRRFNNNAQPYYVLLNEQGELLAKPKAYDLSVPNFVEFLELGKKRFAAGETVEDPALARK